MDYSLLVGIDEEKRELACGLVDAIGEWNFHNNFDTASDPVSSLATGAFTIFKALESKGKQLAKGSSGAEVTVVRFFQT